MAPNGQYLTETTLSLYQAYKLRNWCICLQLIEVGLTSVGPKNLKQRQCVICPVTCSVLDPFVCFLTHLHMNGGVSLLREWVECRHGCGFNRSPQKSNGSHFSYWTYGANRLQNGILTLPSFNNHASWYPLSISNLHSAPPGPQVPGTFSKHACGGVPDSVLHSSKQQEDEQQQTVSPLSP